MAKYIFVTGGVVSSVGKGITVASLGTILKSRKISVSVQKLDPYLNVDPGTMSPYQHGEVFVTKDGAETDLDLGNYERFIDIELTADSNVTSGQIYSAVIAKERRGDFLGGTIQVVPHVTAEIKKRFKRLAEKSQADVVIIEVGGTVGDIEGQPFLEAIRQMRNDVGRDNVLFIHVTLLPYINTTKELKTKPTQHSVNELRRIGIQPDIIICRSDYPISDSIRNKISLFCDVEREAVIPLPTVPTIYEVPLILEEEGIGKLLVKKLGLKKRRTDLNKWRQMVGCLKESCETVTIALVGKYVELEDAYYSVREALCHAALAHNRTVKIEWLDSEQLDGTADDKLGQVQGIVQAAPLPQGGGAPRLEDGTDHGDLPGRGDAGGPGDEILGPVDQQVHLVEVAEQDVGIDVLVVFCGLRGLPHKLRRFLSLCRVSDYAASIPQLPWSAASSARRVGIIRGLPGRRAVDHRVDSALSAQKPVWSF